MMKIQNKIQSLLNITAIIDNAKCFQWVRELRWPDNVHCPHCSSDMIVKNGRDETQSEVTVHTPWQPIGFCRVSTAGRLHQNAYSQRIML